MQLDKAASYALSATVCIAREADRDPIRGRTVAGLCQIPFEYLLKILQQLARNGILSSERGRGGGFRLGRRPDRITVLQIMEAIQGPVRVRVCTSQEDCATLSRRMLEDTCDDIATYARGRLSRLTVADLMRAT